MTIAEEITTNNPMKHPAATAPNRNNGANSVCITCGCIKTMISATNATRAIFITLNKKQMMIVNSMPNNKTHNPISLNCKQINPTKLPIRLDLNRSVDKRSASLLSGEITKIMDSKHQKGSYSGKFK